MELAFQMTGGMFVVWKFRAEIDAYSTALTIEAEHRQLVCAGVHIGFNREAPAATNARNIDVITARFMQRRKIGRLDVVSGVWVVREKAHLSLKRDTVVTAAFDKK